MPGIDELLNDEPGGSPPQPVDPTTPQGGVDTLLEDTPKQPTSIDDLLADSGDPKVEEAKQGIIQGVIKKAGDIYNRAADWAGEPAKLSEVKDIQSGIKGAGINIAKGGVGLGVGVTELVKMELGGLNEWIKDPKKSFESLKQGPSIIKDTIVMPIIEDVKDLYNIR